MVVLRGDGDFERTLCDAEVELRDVTVWCGVVLTAGNPLPRAAQPRREGDRIKGPCFLVSLCVS